MPTNPPLNRQEVTAPTGSPDDVLAPGVPGGFPGNQKDDDAQALDDYFEAADSGPQEYMGITPPVSELPTTTRLVNWGAYLLPLYLGAVNPRSILALPADPNRRRIYINVVNTEADPGWFCWGSEPFSSGLAIGIPGTTPPPSRDPGMGGVAFALLPDNGNGLVPVTLVLEEHTGPLYVGCWDNAAGGILVGCSIQAVTC